MTNAEIAASKRHMALRKVSDKNVALIVGALLRRYKRYGLAEIVEMAWDWKPRESDETNEKEMDI